MKLDRSKKYEGLEMVWEFNAPMKQWCGYLGGYYLMANANDEMAQKWLDAGHIKPVRETKIVQVEGVQVQVVRSRDGGLKLEDFAVVSGYCAYDLPQLAVSQPVTLKFEVDA